MIKTNRIKWVDSFKALAILCMLVGHITGSYNMFIYQGHMAAFFIISGYTYNPQKRSILELIYNKTCTLIMPLIVTFFFMIVLLNLLYLLWPNIEWNSPFGLGGQINNCYIIRSFFTKSLMYISWLGACWFLIVLFEAFLLQRFVFAIGHGKILFQGIISGTLFLLGYFLVCNEYNPGFMLELALVAQFYVFIGFFLREMKWLDCIINKSYIFIMFLVTIVGLYFFAYIVPTINNWPSHQFGLIYIDVVCALNFSLFLFVTSNLLSKLGEKYQYIISYIGSNTMPLLLFHFLSFRITAIILVFAGVEGISYIDNFVPVGEAGDKYLVLYLLVTFFFSFGVWRVIEIVRPISWLLGQRKNEYNLTSMCFKNYIGKIILTITEWLLNAYFYLRDYYRNLNIWYSEHKKESLASILILVLISTLLMHQGVTVDDELQQSLHREEGIGILFNWLVSNDLNQGRPLRVLSALNTCMSFVSQNYFFSRTIQIFIIILSLGLFGYFVKLIFNNNRLSALSCLLWVMFLQLGFEPGVPNAYVSLTAVPVIELFIALITFVKYLRESRIVWLILTCVFWILAMLGYEFMVTYLLLFPAIAIYFYGSKNYSLCIKKSFPMFFLSIIYISSLLLLQEIIDVNYNGLQIELDKPLVTVQVIWTIFKSSLPGAFLWMDSYKYLYGIYHSVINNIQLFSLFRYHITLMDILFASVTAFLLNRIVGDKFKLKNISVSYRVLLVLLLYMFLPIIPNSLTKMYHDSSFHFLPVNYGLSFVMALFIGYVLYFAFSKFQYSLGKIFILFLTIYSMLLFNLNSVISFRQYEDYSRLILMQYIADDVFTKLHGSKGNIFAHDMYLTKNALGIHDGYWNERAAVKHSALTFSSAKAVYNNEAYQIYDNGSSFTFVNTNGDSWLYTWKPLEQSVPIRIGINKTLMFKGEKPIRTHGIYVYKIN